MRDGLTVTSARSLLLAAGQVLDLDEHQLGGFQGGEPDDDVADATVDVGVSRCHRIPLHQVRLTRRRTLEGSFRKGRCMNSPTLSRS
jgi:hypothetical protein